VLIELVRIYRMVGQPEIAQRTSNRFELSTSNLARPPSPIRLDLTGVMEAVAKLLQVAFSKNKTGAEGPVCTTRTREFSLSLAA
jgi:hypothetical protein